MTLSVSAPSVSEEEVLRFSKLAQSWWDPKGKLRFLHLLGPQRIAYVQDQCAVHFGASKEPLSILDVGCGGGLLSEPLARWGARVTAIDVAEETLAAARHHAKTEGLDIEYRLATAEDLAASGKQYDVVTAMEVVEHVADLDSFLKALAQLVRPGGILVLSSLNRTPLSFLLGIVVAEYVTGWVPAGTHDWNKFRKPSELAAGLGLYGVETSDVSGLVYNPLDQTFCRAKGKTGLDYLLTGLKVNK